KLVGALRRRAHTKSYAGLRFRLHDPLHRRPQDGSVGCAREGHETLGPRAPRTVRREGRTAETSGGRNGHGHRRENRSSLVENIFEPAARRAGPGKDRRTTALHAADASIPYAFIRALQSEASRGKEIRKTQTPSHVSK